MTREEAFKILKTLITNENLIRHHLACEAAMKALYKRLNKEQNPKDAEKWGIVGLLHDADYELTKDTPQKHTIILEEKIGEVLDPDIMYAIKSHNFQNNKVEPKSAMDWSIYCCDELTGLIIAAALISPEKNLVYLDADFIMNRFSENSFAKGANRDQIKHCEEKLGIPLNEFIQIVLSSMQEISSELGL
jgi:predicted hydrolase (HD superfamily)